MRIAAYIMLGDPAFLRQSLRSYYNIVDEVLAIFDSERLSWAGRPLEVDECLEIIRGVDTQSKVRYLSGDFHNISDHPLEAETQQRQAALDELGAEWDWILQIDTDEIVGDQVQLIICLRSAEEAARMALDYPARWIYTRCNNGLYLERCRRLWQISANYPGPIAVKPGVKLRHARQTDDPVWHVDFARHSTDPYQLWRTVDQIIPASSGLWHMSWVRSEEGFLQKGVISGHAGDLDWADAMRLWVWRSRHPWWATIGTPFRRRPPILGSPTWLRPVKIPQSLLM